MKTEAEKKATKAARAKRHREKNKEKIKEKKATFHAENREAISAKAAANYAKNKEHRKATSAAWKTANPERSRQAVASWFAANSDRVKSYKASYYQENRKLIWAKHLARLQNDDCYAIARRLRKNVSCAISRGRTKKTETTHVLIGCSIQECIRHIESRFLPGMSWDRMSEIHIDHIVPVAHFDLRDPEQQKACFHFTNLQPLWARDNLTKGAKMPDGTRAHR